MWAQQQPPRTSGRSGKSAASARFCSSRVSASTIPVSGCGNSSHAASAIASPPSPHACGTRTSPERKTRPHAWHSYSGPSATAVYVLQSGHFARRRLTSAPSRRPRPRSQRAFQPARTDASRRWDSRCRLRVSRLHSPLGVAAESELLGTEHVRHGLDLVVGDRVQRETFGQMNVAPSHQRDYSSTRVTTIEALCPPKPNELETATRK